LEKKKVVLILAVISLVFVLLGFLGWTKLKRPSQGKDVGVLSGDDPAAVLEQAYADIRDLDFSVKAAVKGSRVTDAREMRNAGYFLDSRVPVYIPHVVFSRYQTLGYKPGVCDVEVQGSKFSFPQWPWEIEVISCYKLDGKDLNSQVPLFVRFKWDVIDAQNAEFSKWGFLLQSFNVDATALGGGGATEVYMSNPFGGRASALVKDGKLIKLEMSFMPDVKNYQALKRFYGEFDRLGDMFASRGSGKARVFGVGWGRKFIPREYWTSNGYRVGGLKAYTLSYLDGYPVVKGELVTWADFPMYMTLWFLEKDKGTVDSIRQTIQESVPFLNADVSKMRGLYRVTVWDLDVKKVVEAVKPLPVPASTGGEGKTKTKGPIAVPDSPDSEQLQ